MELRLRGSIGGFRKPKLVELDCDFFKEGGLERLDLFFSLPRFFEREEFACPSLGSLLFRFSSVKEKLVGELARILINEDRAALRDWLAAVDSFVKALEGLNSSFSYDGEGEGNIPEVRTAEFRVPKKDFELANLRKGRGGSLELAKACLRRKEVKEEDFVRTEDRAVFLEKLKDLLTAEGGREAPVLVGALEVFEELNGRLKDSSLPLFAVLRYLFSHYFPFHLEVTTAPSGRLVCVRFANKPRKNDPLPNPEDLKRWRRKLITAWLSGENPYCSRGEGSGATKKLSYEEVYGRALKRLAFKLGGEFFERLVQSLGYCFSPKSRRRRELLKKAAIVLERAEKEGILNELDTAFLQLVRANAEVHRRATYLRDLILEKGRMVGLETDFYSRDPLLRSTPISSVEVKSPAADRILLLHQSEITPKQHRALQNLRKTIGEIAELENPSFVVWNFNELLGEDGIFVEDGVFKFSAVLKLFLIGEALNRLKMPVIALYPKRRQQNRFYDATAVLKFFTHKQFLTDDGVSGLNGRFARVYAYNSLSSLFKGGKELSAFVGGETPFTKEVEVLVALTERYLVFDPDEETDGQDNFFGGGRLFKVVVKPAEGGVRIKVRMLTRYFFLPPALKDAVKTYSIADEVEVGEELRRVNYFMHLSEFADDSVNDGVENFIRTSYGVEVLPHRGKVVQSLPLWVLKRERGTAFAEGSNLGLVEEEGLNEYAIVTLSLTPDKNATAFVVRFEDFEEAARKVLRYSMLGLGLLSSDAYAGFEYTKPKPDKEHLKNKKVLLRVGKRIFRAPLLNLLADFMVAATP